MQLYLTENPANTSDEHMTIRIGLHVFVNVGGWHVFSHICIYMDVYVCVVGGLSLSGGKKKE